MCPFYIVVYYENGSRLIGHTVTKQSDIKVDVYQVDNDRHKRYRNMITKASIKTDLKARKQVSSAYMEWNLKQRKGLDKIREGHAFREKEKSVYKQWRKQRRGLRGGDNISPSPLSSFGTKKTAKHTWYNIRSCVVCDFQRQFSSTLCLSLGLIKL